MSEKRMLAVILGLFLLLGFAYALTTPVFEASDELWHYPMIQHLGNGNPLPVQVFDPALAGPWNQEASQPPLYYYLGAALTFWIDTSDMEAVRWLNPHVDNGIITPDGNINLAIHDPAWSRLQGTLLAVYIVRIFSVFLGAGTVWLTYLIGKTAVPHRPEIPLGAAAITAFLPMFLFISGAVNNDNLAVMLASLAVWLMVRGISCQLPVANHRPPATGHWLLLGGVIGLAILTKQGTFALLPLAWGTLFVAGWVEKVGGLLQRDKGTKRRRGDSKDARLAVSDFQLSWREMAGVLGGSLWRFGLFVLLPAALIAGWWYYRNIVLYGDFLGWNAFIAVLGQRAQPASLAQLWSERHGFMMSYWGLFGGVNVPMPDWVYAILNGALLAALAGGAIYAWRELRRWRREIGEWSWRPIPLIGNTVYFVASRFTLVVCLLLVTAVIFGLVQWATTTWSSQGRLVFTAMSALSVLFMVGLVGWLPARQARWLAGGFSGFMLVVAALAPWLWIQPAYQPPVYAAPPANSGVVFGETLRLVGYEFTPTAVSPTTDLWLTLEWEALAPMDRDWSVFVHLNDPVLGYPIAQRDMYPGQGLLATRLLQPGQRIVNRYRLAVPGTAVAPADLELAVGLYDYTTCPACQRLPISDSAGAPTSGEAVILGQLPLAAAAGEYPNPTLVNFGNEAELIGFSADPRRVRPGETVEVTLYWRGKRPLATDYSLFAQIVNLEDTTRYAGQDLAPPLLRTSEWTPGEIQTVTLQLTLADDAPAGVYPLIIGLYTQTEGQFRRLQLVTPTAASPRKISWS
jgi:hypothetical protein